MHITTLTIILILSLVTILIALAEVIRAPIRKNKQVKNRATHAELMQRQKTSKPATQRRKVNLEDVHKVTHRKASRARSLIGRSTVLSGNQHWTIVPKGAVLHVPNYFEARIDGKRDGDLVAWPEFVSRNRNWISIKAVSVREARGDTPIPEQAIENYKRLGRVVVATCRNGPISVKWPAPEASGDQRKQ